MDPPAASEEAAAEPATEDAVLEAEEPPAGTGDTGSSQKAAAGNFSVVHDKRSCF